MTKDQLREMYPNVIFIKSVSGRETANVPLDKEDKKIARSVSGTYVEGEDGKMVYSEEASERSLNQMTRNVAAREVLGTNEDGSLMLGDWVLTSSELTILTA
jgi:hypothetical protein